MADKAGGTGAGGDPGDIQQVLYGLMELAEEQQVKVGTALAGLAAERAAFGKQVEAVRGEIVRLQQVVEAVRPALAQAARVGVNQGLAGAGVTAVAAVEAAAAPVLARLDAVATQAGAAEAALRRVVSWASWRLLGRGAAVVAGLAGLLWLTHLLVWWWTAWNVSTAQAQKAVLRAEIAGLQIKRDELEASRTGLEQMGALAKITRCNPGNRPCIRINEAAGAFTAGSDTYRVIQGY